MMNFGEQDQAVPNMLIHSPSKAVWLLDPSKHHFVGQPEEQSKEAGWETVMYREMCNTFVMIPCTSMYNILHHTVCKSACIFYIH